MKKQVLKHTIALTSLFGILLSGCGTQATSSVEGSTQTKSATTQTNATAKPQPKPSTTNSTTTDRSNTETSKASDSTNPTANQTATPASQSNATTQTTDTVVGFTPKNADEQAVVNTVQHFVQAWYTLSYKDLTTFDSFSYYSTDDFAMYNLDIQQTRIVYMRQKMWSEAQPPIHITSLVLGKKEPNVYTVDLTTSEMLHSEGTPVPIKEAITAEVDLVKDPSKGKWLVNFYKDTSTQM